MRITHAMKGSTEGSIFVSHIKLGVCSSLILIDESYANMNGLVILVKVRRKVSEVISNKLWP